MNKKIVLLFVGLVLAGAVVFFAAPFVSSVPKGEGAFFPRDRLTVEHADGAVDSFDVEIAETFEQLNHGLMYRDSLPKDAGMLFLFQPPRVVQFWMKNTTISLDMLFVQGDGRISSIHAQARPHDVTTIGSGIPVAGVLEINGGEAERRGIKVGDYIRYKAFGR